MAAPPARSPLNSPGPGPGSGYVLALRRTDVPTARCRPVLLALSAGDHRRQRSLQAGRHLLACPPCAAASVPLLDRRRTLAGLAPWIWGPALFDAARRRTRRHTTTTALTTAAAAAAVILVALVAVVSGPPSGPTRTTAATPASAAPTITAAPLRPIPGLTVAGRPLDAHATRPLSGYQGQPVRADRVLVLSVPADEGFWIGTSNTNRIWVQLRGDVESRQQVRPGQRVTFTGTMAPTPPNFPASTGVTPAEGAAQLAAQPVHIQVNGTDISDPRWRSR